MRCFAKYLAKPFSMENNSKIFHAYINRIFVLIIISSLLYPSKNKIFCFSLKLKSQIFFKNATTNNNGNMGLYLWYSSSKRYIFCNKPFKAFLEHQMSKDEPTALLAIKMWNFTRFSCDDLSSFLRSHLCPYSITIVTTSH